ncbi:MAG TPA: DUF1549 domain-containing protein [Pirellula sp.]|nr:DUF1549 domain-containing protein [Pirellula sp.]
MSVPIGSIPLLLFGLWLTATNWSLALGQEPLHIRIDQLISLRTGGSVSEQSSDAEFLRRIYLDLSGHLPTAPEARAFFEDSTPVKRQLLIERLLADDRYALRMTDAFNIMLIERRSKHEEWFKYLRSSFSSNKPWDTIVREILSPDAESEVDRGSALFYTSRLEHYGQNPPDVPGLVRDVGRMFLGVDVQCAQCHDHLFVDDYKQVDYQGLYAFVANTLLRQDVKFPAVGENPLLKKVAFKSVFGGEEKMTGPRLPFGSEIEIPDQKKGEEYSVPPDKKTRSPGVLKFSPIRVLSESITRSDKPEFARNIVNRLWWMMMGRGLVDPLDLHHSGNPASHPQLLELLAREMVENKFDIKWMLRELALSEAYQRSCIQPADAIDSPLPTSYRTALERPLSADQWFTTLREATGEKTTEAKTLANWKDRFDKVFANPPKEPEINVSPTVKAALFLSNDNVVLSWFERQDGNLVDRLAKMDDQAIMIDEAYLSFLTRFPTDEERTDVERFLKQFKGPREKAIGQMIWSLAASTEFFVNH